MQQSVSDKTNEIPISTEILKASDVSGKVVTTGALLTQRTFCQAIIDGDGTDPFNCRVFPFNCIVGGNSGECLKTNALMAFAMIHAVGLDSRLSMFSSRFGDRSYKKKHKLECVKSKQLNDSNFALCFIDNIRVIWYYSDIIAM
ncbi:MAG: hypothetical protein OXU23_17100 [Candidatus Poribacteria bacterium]|nr:hypothetical protein [Candidatus Poribacteria bacterium]MDE0313755.1 hypothetical protein [Candidatus Poribacteria bacterium]